MVGLVALSNNEVPPVFDADSSCRKCILKDGVLTANGREYVFHKAQGEFEW